MGVHGRKPNLEAGESHKAETPTDFLPLPSSPLPAEFEPDAEMTETGAAIWHKIVPDLVRAQVFRESDSILLTELCESLAMARDFRAQIRILQPAVRKALELGEVVEAELYSAMLKKARTGYRESMQTAMSIAGEFGISPVSRMRLGLLKIQGNSLLAALMAEEEDEK